MNSSFPNRWSFSYLNFTKYVTNIIAEPRYKYGQQEQVTKLPRDESSSAGCPRSSLTEPSCSGACCPGPSSPGSRLIQERVVQNRAVLCLIVLVRYIGHIVSFRGSSCPGTSCPGPNWPLGRNVKGRVFKGRLVQGPFVQLAEADFSGASLSNTAMLKVDQDSSSSLVIII